MEWSDDDERRLQQLWNQTDPVLSTANIARIMKISKNAVVGKAHRLGLPKRASPIIGAGSGAVRVNHARPVGNLRRTLPNLPSLQAPPLPRTPDGRATRSVMRVSAVPVGPISAARPADYQPRIWPKRRFDGSGCMFPIGDPKKPDFRFCDADLDGADYCAHHCSIAYIDSAERRRRLTARAAGIVAQVEPDDGADAEAA